MCAKGKEFVFTEKKNGRCSIVIDSVLKSDSVSGECLAGQIKEISGVEIAITNKMKKGKLKTVLIGTFLESPDIRKILEEEMIILGGGNPRPSNPRIASLFDTGSPSISENMVDVAKSSILRRDYLCPEDLGEQGFIVYEPDEDKLILCGGAPMGTFYAVQTLINHLYLEDGNLKVEDLHTERLPIFSRPSIPIRGVCTNIGGPDHLSYNQWVKEWHKEGEYDYKGFIDWLAQFKINHLDIWSFELGFGIAYPSEKFPECVNKYHPNVKKEFIGEMIDYAHEKFIDVTTFIDFPDMFSGILRHHPELGAKQFDPSELPPEEDWEKYQKTGENEKKHSFRGKFGTVCASNEKVMSFWEEYIEELFSRYPGLDGITGQFAEGLGGICTCDNCQKNFLELQWKYFKRMAEIAQKDRPERIIINCASPGDVEILRHGDEIKNFIHLDWGGTLLPYEYNRACPRGQWYLGHYSGRNWHELSWKKLSQLLLTFRFEALTRRTVSFKPCENDHFAFGEFAWNPELVIEDYADLYTKMSLREKDEDTSALYCHWIKLREYSSALDQLHSWKEDNTPFSAKKSDEEYSYLLKEELGVLSSLLKKTRGKNKLVREIEEVFQECEQELSKKAEIK